MQQGFESLNIPSRTQTVPEKQAKTKTFTQSTKNHRPDQKQNQNNTPHNSMQAKRTRLKLKQTRKTMITSRKSNTELVFDSPRLNPMAIIYGALPVMQK